MLKMLVLSILPLFLMSCENDSKTGLMIPPDEDVLDSSAFIIDGWDLLWNDEFELDSVDRNNWNVIDRENSYNNELQYYTPEDVYVDSNCLVLRSQKRNFAGKLFTSGLVHSRGKRTLQYGMVIVRAKLPAGQGIWPAHWMLPDNGRWPPEIDIMEFLGHDVHTVHMTTHWGVHDGWHPSDHSSFTNPSIDFSAGFHTYAAVWDSASITFYVDGVQRHHVTEGIPHEPFYIILNTAVGGDWPGNPDASTSFPQYHLIDYVRVYKKNNAAP